MPFGTNDVFGLLAAQAGSQTVIGFGEDRVWEAVARGLEIHNRIVSEMLAGRVGTTQDRQRRYGDTFEGEMQRMDEYGTPDAQRQITGATLGFPLDYYTYGLQWTRRYLMNVTVGEIVAQLNAARIADVRRLQREMLRVQFSPVNRLAYTDDLIDKQILPVRALLNADGAPVPQNPYNAATFDGTTHTHFLWATAFNEAAINALITTVQEHGVSGSLRLEISTSQETAMRALTGSFIPVIAANIVIPGGYTVLTARGALDQIDTTNRKIGDFGPAEVWVKPWQFNGYVTCWDTGQSPVVLRSRPGGPSPVGELALEYENEVFPLRARVLGREFGFGIQERHAMAHLYVDAGAVGYVMPTIPGSLY